jgi:16S rRNA (uracil1498-N3)-methyltransferase
VASISRAGVIHGARQSPNTKPFDPMPRLYVASLTRQSTPYDVTLDDDAAQHVRVLRLAAGDAVTLFNGDGGEAEAAIATVEKRSVVVRINAWYDVSRESPINIVLVQSLAVADKMDWIVQKATELGVRAIVPMRAARATLKLDAERAEKRVAHWQGVAIAACEQCGRNTVPTIAAVQAMPEEALSTGISKALAGGKTHFAILHPEAEVSLIDWAKNCVSAQPTDTLALLIGPEGGFDDAELARAARLGATRVRFGPRVLRTETAGIAAIAAINAVLGDLA